MLSANGADGALIASALRDDRLTAGEWREAMGEHLGAPQSIASAPARAVLELRMAGLVEIDADAMVAIDWFLSSRGYPMAAGVEQAPDAAARIAGENVTEPDLELERLAHRIGRTNTTILIGVVDEPIETGTPGLRDNLQAGEAVHIEGSFHGTMVAGLATRGSARVKLVQGLKDNGQWIAEIQRVIDAGARIVNTSFAVQGVKAVEAYLELLEKNPDVVFLKSAGNSGCRVGSEASYGFYGPRLLLNANVRPNLIAVANADATGARAASSCFGSPQTLIAAHGDGVNTFDAVDDSFAAGSGTSAASPAVANVVAKCLLLDPALTPADIKNLVVLTARRDFRWMRLVAAGGLLDETRAIRVAALTALLRDEVDPASAIARLELSEAEGVALLELAQRVLSGKHDSTSNPRRGPCRSKPVVHLSSSPGWSEV